jgi:hypothetical protein
MGSPNCNAYVDGNTGCGVELAGEGLYGSASFGRGVNEVGGGYYAMWRDLEQCVRFTDTGFVQSADTGTGLGGYIPIIGQGTLRISLLI